VQDDSYGTTADSKKRMMSLLLSQLLAPMQRFNKDNTEQSTADWFGILLATVATRITFQ